MILMYKSQRITQINTKGYREYVPFTSSESNKKEKQGPYSTILNSVRRLAAMPSSVLLSAIG